jgi:hypothetical protein
MDPRGDPRREGLASALADALAAAFSCDHSQLFRCGWHMGLTWTNLSAAQLTATGSTPCGKDGTRVQLGKSLMFVVVITFAAELFTTALKGILSYMCAQPLSVLVLAGHFLCVDNCRDCRGTNIGAWRGIGATGFVSFCVQRCYRWTRPLEHTIASPHAVSHGALGSNRSPSLM